MHDLFIALAYIGMVFIPAIFASFQTVEAEDGWRLDQNREDSLGEAAIGVQAEAVRPVVRLLQAQRAERRMLSRPVGVPASDPAGPGYFHAPSSLRTRTSWPR